MPKYKAVIGSNFGDEAKGMSVAKIAQQNKEDKILNVRFNGGFQAGHTVQLGDKHHVFKGYGASTFFGADTFLTEDFIFNPIFFLTEMNRLKEFGHNPKVYLSKKAVFTTPIDAFLNMKLEERRGRNRHGSVGIGIFETLKRCENHTEFTTFYDFIYKCPNKIKWLEDIVNDYIPQRMKELDFLDREIYHFQTSFKDDVKFLISILRSFTLAVDAIEFVEFDDIKNKYDLVIFEGAQGLLLDQNNEEYFPHLTPSNCGIKNIVKLLKEEDKVEVFYATRPYLTRHGAGLFKTEVKNKDIISSKIEDFTNVPNDFQQTLRFGLLDIDELNSRIEKDLQNDKLNQFTPYISLSCIDQIDKRISVFHNSKQKKVDLDIFISLLQEKYEIGLFIDSPSL